MADTNMETKELSATAEEYLWGVIYCADWIKPAYKKFADAYRTNPKALRELYLCFCDHVPESALKDAAKSDRVEVAFKICRKEHLEKEWLGDYSKTLQELSSISGEIGTEVKQMAGTVSNIAESMPNWDAMFSKEVPAELPSKTVTTEIASKAVEKEKSKTVEALSIPAPATGMKNESAEEKGMERMVPKKKGKGNLIKLLKKKISEIHHYKSHPSLFVIELFSQGYTDVQINFILDCMEQGMTEKEIDEIADPKIPVDMMKKLRDMYFKKKENMENGKR